MAEVFTISGAQGFGAAPRSAPMRLQNALKALGNVHGDPSLSKLAVDGVIGKGTTAAVNHAIDQKYVVMSSFPNPDLTVQHVRKFATGIAAAVESAVKSAGGTFPLIPASAGRKKATTAEVAAAAAAAAEPPLAPAHSNTVWWIIGGAGLVLALGFFASSRRQRRREAEA